MSAKQKYKGGDRKELQKLLRDNNFRSTEGRLALLSVLKNSHKPIAVDILAKKVDAQLDQVNVYRALESFAKAGMVHRVDLQHGHAHYEFTHGDDHHHLICTACDKVEDFVGCEYEKLVTKALAQTRAFRKVTHHSFELFGLCNTCAKA